MFKIGIIGFGEIGSSLKNIYSEKSDLFEVKIVDKKLNLNEDLSNSHILNICIPYSKNFISIINEYISQNSPTLVVIHSTVAPGTTKQIKGRVCHSPVRGVHPNIDIGLKTFVKYIGAEDASVAQQYSEHLKLFDIKSYICKNSITSEYAKLLDTTYYGICIAFHADVMNLCETHKLDFEEVMTLYNTSYNQGYSLLNKQNVVRPVLYGTKKIGGHCVVPNAKILKDYIDSPLIEGILKYE